MTNLLLSMLDKVGVHAETLGDSTGRLPKCCSATERRVQAAHAYAREAGLQAGLGRR